MQKSALALMLYLVFLAGYAIYKYAAAAPPAFSPAYAQSVAMLVALTGVAPFLLSLGALKALRLKGVAGAAAGLLLGLVLCVAGYAAFWAVIIAPSGAPVAMTAVAVRGVGWGLLQGGLAAIAAGR